MKANNQLAIAVLAAALTACSGSGSSDRTALSGAGATFPLPYYNVTFEGMAQKNPVDVSYGGIGSGGGVRSLKDGIVDFAATDAFITDEEMKDMKPIIHIPTCMGAVVLAYNLDGVDSLNLTGKLIADIFAGRITKWNDKSIAEVNTHMTLPDKEILPVYRADGSGTTFVFTDYLSKADRDWELTYGRGKTVNFPVGQAAKGNPGVAGIIANTEGSIGYVGSEYAFAQGIKYASVRNPHGEVVRPDAASISLAAQGEIPEDTRTTITNSDAEGAYPISCFTWIVVYADQNYSDRTMAQAKATGELLQYMLSDEAQARAEAVHYAPLPKPVVEQSRKNLEALNYGGHKLQ